jgi:hypothetical protein
MNPRGETSHSFELPPTPGPNEAGTEQDQGVERAPAAPESAPGKQAPTAVVAVPQQPIALPVLTDTPVIPGDDAAEGPHTPAAGAQDSDLIEKEWVDRAKAIIAQTRDDPHEQNRAMGTIKAEYIKKRYGKTIKTDDPAIA